MDPTIEGDHLIDVLGYESRYNEWCVSSWKRCANLAALDSIERLF